MNHDDYDDGYQSMIDDDYDDGYQSMIDDDYDDYRAMITSDFGPSSTDSYILIWG